jgi:hypothetical protein
MLISPGSVTLPQYSSGYISSFMKANNTTTAWDTSVYSAESYANNVVASAQSVGANTVAMFGLTTNPTASNSYTNLNYAFYFNGGLSTPSIAIYESGSAANANVGIFTASTKLTIQIDGKYVRYYVDNNVVRQIDFTPSTTPYYYQACFYNSSSPSTYNFNQLVNMQFGSGLINNYWTEHNEGYLYRGGWMHYRNYYPGDIVRYGADIFMCSRRNYNGHPYYKNGYTPTANTVAPNSDWTKLASGTPSLNDDAVVLFPNMNPLGWTKFKSSWYSNPGHQFTINAARIHFGTVGGNVYRAGDALAEGSSVNQSPPTNLAFPFDDYKYGRLPGYAGKPPKIIQIVGSDYFYYYLFDNGELYSWGQGPNGENGDGQNNTNAFPTRVGFVVGTHDVRAAGTSAGILANIKIVKVCSSNPYNDSANHHVLALDSSGKIWSWGYNGYGQLGQGDSLSRNVPTVINPSYFNNTPIVDIFTTHAIYGRSYAIDANGNLWIWGDGNYGSGAGTNRNTGAPVLVPYDWQHYGGIKKIYPVALSVFAGDSGGVIVLTNDGTIHTAGEASISGGSYTNPTYGLVVFRPRADFAPRAYEDLFVGGQLTQGIGQKIWVKYKGTHDWNVVNSYFGTLGNYVISGYGDVAVIQQYGAIDQSTYLDVVILENGKAYINQGDATPTQQSVAGLPSIDPSVTLVYWDAGYLPVQPGEYYTFMNDEASAGLLGFKGSERVSLITGIQFKVGNPGAFVLGETGTLMGLGDPGATNIFGMQPFAGGTNWKYYQPSKVVY